MTDADVQGFRAIAFCLECDFTRVYGPDENVAWYERDTRAKRSASAHRATTKHRSQVVYELPDGDRRAASPLDDAVSLPPESGLGHGAWSP